MLDIRCVDVGKCQSEDSSVCFGAKPTQRACTRDFPRDRKRTREGRPESQQMWTEEIRAENRAVSRREQATARMWGLKAGLADVRGWVSVPYGFVGISLEYTLALAHRCTECYKSITNFSLLALGANPSPRLFVLFSSTFSVVYVVFWVSVKKCEKPLVGDERNH